MKSEANTPRRNFLGQLAGAAAVAGLSMAGSRAVAAGQSAPDDWIQEVKGRHRCLFDFPQHKNGMPLLHIANYLGTYASAYKAAPGTVSFSTGAIAPVIGSRSLNATRNGLSHAAS